MATDFYTLERFVGDLRSIAAGSTGDKTIVHHVRPLAQRLVLSGGFLKPRHFQCDEEQGFSFNILHEEPDHTLSVAVLSWLPGRGTPPHNHGTWGIVVGVKGREKNVFWRRVDDGARPGHARLEKMNEKEFETGEAIVFLRDTIHSVINETDRISTSLHVYGKNVNYTGRSQFDVAADREIPWLVKQT